MPETLHGFLFCVETCHYLHDVTNKIQNTQKTNKDLYLIWCRHYKQDVPECLMSADFFVIYVFHFLCQFNEKLPHNVLYLGKFLFMLVAKIYFIEEVQQWKKK
jgi:hypothetical protein